MTNENVLENVFMHFRRETYIFMSKKKTITIKDVARAAQVSISTVSRFINTPDSVSEKLKERIDKAIKDLGYRPNRIGQSLRTGSTKLIGFIIPDITNPAFLLIVKGAEDYLKKHGYSFILCGSDHSVREESKLLRALISQGVDGLIVTCSGGHNSELNKVLSAQHMHIVFVDRKYERVPTAYVGADNYSGLEKMMDYLVQTGHKSFVYLCGEKQVSSAKERLAGFLNGVKKYGIEDYQVLFGEFTFESGYSLTKTLRKVPDAIVAGNDLMAFGTIQALREKGYKVPEDVSVVGFDDMFFSKYYKPSLTTIRQPIYNMGRKAGRMLLSLMSGKKIKNKNVILDTEIVVRNSTKSRN